MIQLKNVSKKLSGKQIINNLSCHAERGILHISGGNGSGKSTLLNMMAGSLKPDEGQILYSGMDVFKNKNEQVKKRIGYIPAVAPIYPFLTGAEFLKFICHVKQSKWPSELIEIFNLASHLDVDFLSMSYGTKKKFLFISGVLSKPQYFLLDEPMNGLDKHAANEMFTILAKHLETENGLCVIVTHDESWIHNWQGRFSYQNIKLSS